MSNLSYLITLAESRSLSGDVSGVDFPQLITALRELEGMIGHEEVKNSIAIQVHRLLTEGLKKDAMLNTVLYGPPGVGKTRIGTALAKIWHSLGYIKKKEHNVNIGEMMKDFDISTFYMVVIAISTIYLVFSLLSSLVSTIYSFLGSWGRMFFTMLFILFLVAVIFLLFMFVQTETQAEDDNIITVVSREDFVDKYVGWTDKKTKALLERHLGKVLFVDEAYSLGGTFDQYGREALDTMNRFISEHPGEIIIIFAGYRELLKENVFNVQPGLERRFMWQFDCQKYTGEELYKIFLTQLGSYGLEDEKGTANLIRSHADIFINQGGDTDKLVYFAQHAYSEDAIRGRKTVQNKLSLSHIERGMELLEKNNISMNKGKNGNITYHPMSAALRDLFERSKEKETIKKDEISDP